MRGSFQGSVVPRRRYRLVGVTLVCVVLTALLAAASPSWIPGMGRTPMALAASTPNVAVGMLVEEATAARRDIDNCTASVVQPSAGAFLPNNGSVVLTAAHCVANANPESFRFQFPGSGRETWHSTRVFTDPGWPNDPALDFAFLVMEPDVRGVHIADAFGGGLALKFSPSVTPDTKQWTPYGWPGRPPGLLQCVGNTGEDVSTDFNPPGISTHCLDDQHGGNVYTGGANPGGGWSGGPWIDASNSVGFVTKQYADNTQVMRGVQLGSKALVQYVNAASVALPSMPANGYSPVAVNSNLGGEAALVGSNAVSYHNACCNSTGSAAPWSGWQSITTNAPQLLPGNVIGTDADGRMEIFAVTASHALSHSAQPRVGAGFGPWGPVAPAGVSSPYVRGIPAVGKNADGRLEVFVRGKNNDLLTSTQSCPGCGWDSWRSLGGSFQSDPVINQNADGRLEAFVRNSNYGIDHTWQTTTKGNGNWHAWQPVAAGLGFSTGLTVATLPTSIRNDDGRLELFALASNGALLHTDQCNGRPSCGGWTTWSRVVLVSSPTFFVGSPTVGKDADGHLDVLMRAANGAVWQIFETKPPANNTETWGAFRQPTPGAVIVGDLSILIRHLPEPEGPANWTSNDNGGLEIFGLGKNLALWHSFQCGGTTCPMGWQTPWKSLGGGPGLEWPQSQSFNWTKYDNSFEHSMGNPVWHSLNGGTQQNIVCDATAFNQSCFVDTLANVTDASFVQDITQSTTSGQCYALTSWVRTRNTTSVSGRLAVWVLGGTGGQSASYPFTVSGPAQGQGPWTQITAVLPTSAGQQFSKVRGQLYLHDTNRRLDWDLAQWSGPEKCA